MAIPPSRDPVSGTDPTPDADWEAVARYLAGESAGAEAAAVRHWLAEHPAEAVFVQALGQAIVPTADAAGDVDVEAALRRVRALRDESSVRPIGVATAAVASSRSPERGDSPLRVPRPRSAGGMASLRSRWPIAIAVAAGVFFVATAVVLRVGAAHRRAGTLAGARVFTTPVGQRDSVLLADGSRVLLGPGSELRVSAGFGATRRDVELVGEGYFDVKHDAARPFSVHAGGATIRDVGTSFAVHDDAALGLRVAVTSGAVKLQAPGREANLAAGDVAVLAPDGTLTSARGGVRDADLAWTHGSLVFRDASMAEVRADLRRWYGIELRITDSTLAHRRLTATFTGEPADKVLHVIALTVGGEVNRRGDTAFVSERVR